MISHQSNLVAAGSFYKRTLQFSTLRNTFQLRAFKMGGNFRTGTHVREASTTH